MKTKFLDKLPCKFLNLKPSIEKQEVVKDGKTYILLKVQTKSFNPLQRCARIALILSHLFNSAKFRQDLSIIFTGKKTTTFYASDEVYNFLTIKQEAEAGSPDAQYTLAEMYEKGTVIPQSTKTALIWYTNAAEQNHKDAQYTLGRINEQGILEIPSDAVAFIWYKKAAKQNHKDAQYSLGRMCQKGKGIPNRDYKEAARWFTKAAEQAHPNALYSLGKLHEKGRGVPQNISQAITLYKRAALKAHPKAIAALNRIELFQTDKPKPPLPLKQALEIGIGRLFQKTRDKAKQDSLKRMADLEADLAIQDENRRKLLGNL